jgi:hypothetical protein
LQPPTALENATGRKCRTINSSCVLQPVRKKVIRNTDPLLEGLAVAEALLQFPDRFAQDRVSIIGVISDLNRWNTKEVRQAMNLKHNYEGVKCALVQESGVRTR